MKASIEGGVPVVTRLGSAVRSFYVRHTAAIGVGLLVAIYGVFGLVLAWIRWGA